VRLLFGPGQRQDITRSHELIASLKPEAVIADKGYDADHRREAIGDAGAEPVLPAKANRRQRRPHDELLCKECNSIKRLFGKLKQIRRVATRHDRLLANDEGFVQLAALAILLR